jgi:hypothetical protein
MSAPSSFQTLIVTFGAGERIFTEGEVGTTMFIVQSGRIRLFHQADGKTTEIAEMEKGDFFGEMSLLEGTARNISAEAIEPVELIEINSTTFDRMIRGNIEIAVRLLRKLSGRLQKAETLLATRLALAPPPPPAAVAPPQPRPAPPIPASAPSRPSPIPAAGPQARREPVSTTVATPAGAPAARPGPVHAPAAPATRQAPSMESLAQSLRAPGIPAGGAGPVPSVTTRSAAPPREPAGPGARLVSESGESTFPIAGKEATLGRYDPVTETQPEVDLTLVDTKRSVSRRHAKIVARDGEYFLTEEVGALNGTFVNGTKLVAGKPAALKNGDQINLGTVRLVFRI